VIYTTGAIESLNDRFRQATRRWGHFPSEQAALKVLYLVIRTPQKTGQRDRRDTRLESSPEFP
jgi:putative transposase